MPSDESVRAPARLSDLASASVENVLGSSGPPPLACSSSQGRKLRRHRLDTLEDDNPRQRKLFSRDSARNVDVVVELLVAICPFSVAIADAILHNHISPWRPSPARLNYAPNFFSAPAVAPREPRMTSDPSLVPELPVHDYRLCQGLAPPNLFR